MLIRQSNVSAQQADLDIETFLSLKSGKNLQLKAEVKDADDNIVVANTIAAQGDVSHIPLTLQNPHLWQGKQDPYLYTVEVSLMDGDKVIDQVRQQTGLRSF